MRIARSAKSPSRCTCGRCSQGEIILVCLYWPQVPHAGRCPGDAAQQVSRKIENRTRVLIESEGERVIVRAAVTFALARASLPSDTHSAAMLQVLKAGSGFRSCRLTSSRRQRLVLTPQTFRLHAISFCATGPPTLRLSPQGAACSSGSTPRRPSSSTARASTATALWGELSMGPYKGSSFLFGGPFFIVLRFCCGWRVRAQKPNPSG